MAGGGNDTPGYWIADPGRQEGESCSRMGLNLARHRSRADRPVEHNSATGFRRERAAKIARAMAASVRLKSRNQPRIVDTLPEHVHRRTARRRNNGFHVYACEPWRVGDLSKVRRCGRGRYAMVRAILKLTKLKPTNTAPGIVSHAGQARPSAAIPRPPRHDQPPRAPIGPGTG